MLQCLMVLLFSERTAIADTESRDFFSPPQFSQITESSVYSLSEYIFSFIYTQRYVALASILSPN